MKNLCVRGHLTPEHLAYAINLGRRRTEWALGHQATGNGCSPGQQAIDLLGAKGEVAFACWVGFPLDRLNIKKDKGWDVILPDGRTVQVRTTKYSRPRFLPFYYGDMDLPADVAVLVHASPDEGCGVVLVGWSSKDQWKTDLAPTGVIMGKQVYGIPTVRLNPMSALKGGLVMQQSIMPLPPTWMVAP
jgi:hypothetical protein